VPGDRPVVAVVGLGGLGAAAAWHAARAGAEVVAFEQFELGHVRGASHDTSRIIRRSYHNAHYVDLAADAYGAWAEVEEASVQSLVTITGGLDLFPPGAALDSDGYRRALTSVGVDHEWIDGAEIRHRWPAFRVGDEVMGLAQADTGIVPAGRATALLSELARREGATLRPLTPVLALEPDGAGVTIVTEAGRHRADVAIVTADAWTSRLLATVGVELPLEVTLEQVTYLRHPDIARMGIGQLPVWIWMDDPSYYGFPVYDPSGPGAGPGATTTGATIKVAEDCGGPPVDPDDRSFDPDPEREARLCRFVEQVFGGPVSVEHSVRCLYTLTADLDFVLDRVPGSPQIVVGLGAAHGFKFAAWFGRTLAHMALRGPGPSGELAPFSLSRAGLHQPIDRSSWLV
jgi:sarcosine oxidase